MPTTQHRWQKARAPCVARILMSAVATKSTIPTAVVSAGESGSREDTARSELAKIRNGISAAWEQYATDPAAKPPHVAVKDLFLRAYELENELAFIRGVSTARIRASL